MLESHYLEIIKCTRCGNCRLECPSYEGGGWESKSARGRMVLAKGLMEGVDATPSLQDSFFTCTSCKACTDVCPSGASPHRVVEDVRGELWRMGVKPAQGESMLKNISDHGNPLGEAVSVEYLQLSLALARHDHIIIAVEIQIGGANAERIVRGEVVLVQQPVTGAIV